MNGPYETEREAAAAAAQLAPGPEAAQLQQGNQQLLEAACQAAGVRLGAWDQRILAWLAGWEPSTVAVVAGLIARAHAHACLRAAARTAAAQTALAEYQAAAGSADVAGRAMLGAGLADQLAALLAELGVRPADGGSP